jgi:hypothetical protein
MLILFSLYTILSLNQMKSESSRIARDNRPPNAERLPTQKILKHGVDDWFNDCVKCHDKIYLRASARPFIVVIPPFSSLSTCGKRKAQKFPLKFKPLKLLFMEIKCLACSSCCCKASYNGCVCLSVTWTTRRISISG